MARRIWIGLLTLSVMAAGLAGCGRLTPAAIQKPLEPAAQRLAAEQLATAFIDVCLAARDRESATRALQARGWPRFGPVWDDPGGVFYAAKPTPATPAGLFVLVDRQPVGKAGQLFDRVTCVGHYPAADAGAMVEAMTRRWGASAPGYIAGSRAWRFRMTGEALTRTQAEVVGPASEAMLAQVRPGEAIVYAQVSYNAPYKDVASLLSVQRPVGP